MNVQRCTSSCIHRAGYALLQTHGMTYSFNSEVCIQTTDQMIMPRYASRLQVPTSIGAAGASSVMQASYPFRWLAHVDKYGLVIFG